MGYQRLPLSASSLFRMSPSTFSNSPVAAASANKSAVRFWTSASVSWRKSPNCSADFLVQILPVSLPGTLPSSFFPLPWHDSRMLRGAEKNQHFHRRQNLIGAFPVICSSASSNFPFSEAWTKNWAVPLVPNGFHWFDPILQQQLLYLKTINFLINCDQLRSTSNEQETSTVLVTLSGFRLTTFNGLQNRWWIDVNSHGFILSSCNL